MKKLIISCDTCLYYEETCIYTGRKFLGKNEECLYERLNENFVHPIYPDLERKFKTHPYKFWKPKEEYGYIPKSVKEYLLTDKDFEL